MSRQTEVPRTEVPRPESIAVLLPSAGTVPMGFAYDLANLMGFTAAKFEQAGGGIPLAISWTEGTYIHANRESLLRDAVEQEFSHLLWIDTDMRFPKDALFRLLARQEPIVGINYSMRRVPPEFVALKKLGFNQLPPVRVKTTEESTGLEECEAIGFGLVLMQTAVLVDVDWSEPLFQNIWDKERDPDGRWVGEDVFFCMKLRDAGHRIMVDHDLSKMCSHVGQFEYRCEHAEVMEEQDGSDNGLRLLESGGGELAEPDGSDG